MENKIYDKIRQTVQDQYGKIAKSATQIQEEYSKTPCCGGTHTSSDEIARTLGYSNQEINSVPQGANLGLGCGNPKAIASLKPGETVLDLGSGGGFDCFLAATEVGESGKVIGVDMTPEMVNKARDNAKKIEANNIEFRLGEIEHLPVADQSIDVIMSNCVINLSPDKPQVFQDAFRVLKPGGRLAISDVVATASLPEEIRKDLTLIASCIGGAESIENIERMLHQIGFEDINIQPKNESKTFIRKWIPDMKLEDTIVSATIEAIKPININN
ncbi:MAG: arsenite methyltransferase [Desulfobacterales bacterium]|nr:arsenite methyltransferase [Desulfobacterales bacterium]